MRKLSLDLVTVAADRGLSVEAHPRDAVRAAFEAVGAQTRRETAEAVARHFPALAYRLPPPRRAWESEDKRLAIFRAAAVVLAHFHNGATALFAESGSAAKVLRRWVISHPAGHGPRGVALYQISRKIS